MQKNEESRNSSFQQYKNTDIFKKSEQQNLHHIKILLQQQFNKTNKINNINQLKQIFEDVLIYRSQDIKILMLLFVICFTQINILEDIKKLKLDKKFSTNKDITNIFSFFTWSQYGNPIQQITNNMPIISKNYHLFKQLFDFISLQNATKLLNQHFLSATFRVPAILRLTINEVLKQQINQLKSQELDFYDWCERRYFSVYLIKKNQQVNSCWLVCVSSKKSQVINRISQMNQSQQEKENKKQQLRQGESNQQSGKDNKKQKASTSSNWKELIALRLVYVTVFLYLLCYYLFFSFGLFQIFA